MNGNRINLSIKPNSQNQSHHIVDIGHFCYNPWDSIGLGYISNVYLGKNTLTNEKVAVKVVDTTGKDQLVLQFLESQIQILKKIKSYGYKHLLRLEETFRVDNKLYIVTEFCEGKDLSKVLRHQKTFGDKDAQTIMKQVIKTYKELYDLGIVHRDLKLSNLLVKNNQVKLADFGFAVPIVNCIEEFPYNAGSPFFMSPEALKRNRFSFESDIWALGVMAYELVFGKLPYQEKVESLQYETIMKSNIEEKLRGVPLSETYKHFITSCMQKDMRVRATPEEVINYEWSEAEEQLPPCFSEESMLQTQTPHLPQQFNSPNLTQLNSPSLTLLPRNNSNPQSKPLYQENSLKYCLPYSEMKTDRIRIVQFQPRNQFSNHLHHRRLPQTQPPYQGQLPPVVRTPSRAFTDVVSHPPFLIKPSLRNQEMAEMFRRNQGIVRAIINYCKFLFNLYGMLERDNFLPEGHLLKSEISNKILSNYSEMNKFLDGQENRFGRVCFLREFSQTQEYAKTKGLVGVNGHFFNSKFNHQTELKANPQVLTNSIKYLKDRIPSSYVLTEQLCQYFNLRQMEDRDIDYFVAQSKIEQLCIPLNNLSSTGCEKLEGW